MFVLHCKRCKNVRWDWVEVSHGESIKVYFCQVHENTVVDPDVERECEQFEVS